MLGPDVHHGVEELTHFGRMDLYIETKKFIYICEIKLNLPAQKAIDQIHERKYYEKFMNKGKDVFLLGISFDESLRNISDYCFEKIN